ncbi:MAG TPA: hypothetical protein V6C52_10095 [Coleofasciculaceae cyanobacterium]|jgi:hypothetical protein
MTPSRHLFFAALVVLLLLNISVRLVQEPPEQATTPDNPLHVPILLDHWRGQDLPLNHNEATILAPARFISRAYHPIEGSGESGTADTNQVIWLNVIESRSIGKLHNFYDSLVASGSRPSILKSQTIPTARGPLRASLIRAINTQGKPYYLLLWYQWPGGNAENRWQWYAEIIKLRIERKLPAWQLVEVATPISQPESNLSQSPDLARLSQFAKTAYEAYQGG